MIEDIKILIEKRHLDAIKKNLTIKLSSIARYLGDAIISHSGSAYWEEDAEFINEMDEDEDCYEIGHHYNGLKRGHHLEIHLLEEGHTVKASYQGQEVYLEKDGKLYCYASNPEWEEIIEQLYKLSSEKETVSKKEEKILYDQETEKEVKSFFSELKRLWNF